MNKSDLLNFISKYHLSGMIDSVSWKVEDNKLKTKFSSVDRNLIGELIMKEFTDMEPGLVFGVHSTEKMKSLLNILDEDITISPNIMNTGREDRTVSLKFSDGTSNMSYMLADLSVIPREVVINEYPTFNVNINLSSDFSSRFIKARNALKDFETFTVIDKNGELYFVFGYSEINSHRVDIPVPVETYDPKISRKISFSSDYLKEILSANKDCVGGNMRISDQGVVHVFMENEKFLVNYYFVEKEN